MKQVYTTILILIAFLAVSSIAHAGDELEFRARLSGDEEVPNVVTDTTGKFKIEFNDGLTKAEFELDVEDGDLVRRAHIHCARAGENGPIVVALLEHKNGGVSTVRLSEDLELEATITNASISNDACGETLADLAQSMRDGLTYVNVHTVANPGGEIRGQIEED